jgi:hypothetical protein
MEKTLALRTMLIIRMRMMAFSSTNYIPLLRLILYFRSIA